MRMQSCSCPIDSWCNWSLTSRRRSITLVALEIVPTRCKLDSYVFCCTDSCQSCVSFLVLQIITMYYIKRVDLHTECCRRNDYILGYSSANLMGPNKTHRHYQETTLTHTHTHSQSRMPLCQDARNANTSKSWLADQPPMSSPTLTHIRTHTHAHTHADAQAFVCWSLALVTKGIVLSWPKL